MINFIFLFGFVDMDSEVTLHLHVGASLLAWRSLKTKTHFRLYALGVPSFEQGF